MSGSSQAARHPLAALHELGRAARRAETARELEFIAVNDSRALAPYRQAALWLPSGGVRSLSGVVKLDAHVPYAQWLNEVCTELAARSTSGPLRVTASDLQGALGAEWAQWLPSHAVWIPLYAPGPPGHAEKTASTLDGALLFARDIPWTDAQLALLAEWAEVWFHSWRTHARPRSAWWEWRARLMQTGNDNGRWWKHPVARWTMAVTVIACIPVRLSVLAPGELVPAKPAVLRSPMEGVIDAFHVQPNEFVKKDQPLFGFDELLIQSKLEVTRQALETAEAEYQQTAQQALTDPKSKAQLVMLTGRIEEKRAESLYVADQLKRARVLAPQDGIALFDDPSEWIGRPVAVGERIMRVAALDDVEIEAWVPIAEAIPLAADAKVSLYLSASPLSPVDATLRYMSHEALQRPDMSYAYRLRARLTVPTDHRVGLKGTAKILGRWVPLVYWVLRRPLASFRAYTGW